MSARRRHDAAVSPGMGRASELDDPRRDATAVHGELSGRDGQLESPRTGASGVDVEHPVAPLDRRAMRMTGDDDLHARGTGFEIDLGEVVDRVDQDVAEAKELALAQARGPGA